MLKSIGTIIKAFTDYSKELENKKLEKFRSFSNLCSEGSAEEVGNLLRTEKINLKDKFFNDETSNHLCQAIRSNNVEVFKVLLRHGAELNPSLLPDLKTPLHIACEIGNYEIAEILVIYIYFKQLSYLKTLSFYFHDSFFSKMDKHSRTPLHYAVTNRHVKIVAFLLETKVDFFYYQNLLTVKNVLKYFGGKYDDEGVEIIKMLMFSDSCAIERSLLCTFLSGDAAIRKFIASGEISNNLTYEPYKQESGLDYLEDNITADEIFIPEVLEFHPTYVLRQLGPIIFASSEPEEVLVMGEREKNREHT